MLCWKCKKISPTGSLYCAYCPGSLSFNCVVCAKGHRNPVGVNSCATCGNPELSNSTLGIPTGPVSWVATVVVMILIWKLVFAYGGAIAGGLWWVASHGFGFLTNSSQSALGNLLNGAGAWLIFLWMIGLAMSILPGSLGKIGVWMRNLPFQLALKAFRQAPRALGTLWRTVVTVSGLRSSKPSGNGKDR